MVLTVVESDGRERGGRKVKSTLLALQALALLAALTYFLTAARAVQRCWDGYQGGADLPGDRFDLPDHDVRASAKGRRELNTLTRYATVAS